MGKSTLWAAVFLATLSSAAVPDDVSATVFVYPSGSQLQILIRVPMVAFGEIQFPTREGGNYLNVQQVEDMLPGVGKYWVAPNVEAYEAGALLPQPRVLEARLAVESDPSFTSFERALAHLTGPRMDAASNVFWRQAWADFYLESPIRSAQSDFSIRLKLAHLGARVHTHLKAPSSDGGIREFAYDGDAGIVPFDPHWGQSAVQFFRWGLLHFSNGGDYLVFVLCLVLPLRTFNLIATTAAGFAVAASVTLIASARGLAATGQWFQPLIETVIAAGILYLALANIAGWMTSQRRAALALGFGLAFGFAFWFGLKPKVQFAGDHPLTAAVAFDAGILLALAAAIAAVTVLVRLAKRLPGTHLEVVIPSVLAAHTAWHWMTDRWDRFALFPLSWPALDADFLSTAFLWMMILVLLFGGAWFVTGLARKRAA